MKKLIFYLFFAIFSLSGIITAGSLIWLTVKAATTETPTIGNNPDTQSDIPLTKIGEYHNVSLYRYDGGVVTCFVLALTNDDYTTIPTISCVK